MLLVAVENRNTMTGTEFQAWLDGLEAKSQKTMAAEKQFVGWQLSHFIKERSEEEKKKEDAHLARMEQISEYCEVATIFFFVFQTNRRISTLLLIETLWASYQLFMAK